MVLYFGPAPAPAPADASSSPVASDGFVAVFASSAAVVPRLCFWLAQAPPPAAARPRPAIDQTSNPKTRPRLTRMWASYRETAKRNSARSGASSYLARQSDSEKSRARSVHQRARLKPALRSDRSSPARLNFVLISVRISSPAAK